jgi:hypothetical protein
MQALTQKEQEVLLLICNGWSTDEIAANLEIADRPPHVGLQQHLSSGTPQSLKISRCAAIFNRWFAAYVGEGSGFSCRGRIQQLGQLPSNILFETVGEPSKHRCEATG